MSKEAVLAIDFGTSNTYYSKCSTNEAKPESVNFNAGSDGLSTVILYRESNGESKPPLIGKRALEEYGEATLKERAGYVLRAQFKPDIASGDEAKRAATDFLKAVLEDARKQCLDIDPENKRVIFGAPCEKEAKEYRSALMDAAYNAGYGNIEIVDEPKGALFHHLNNRQIPINQAYKGVLVVDFGGGTCDFAYLRRGKVAHSWGDTRLGGRLFDDLFFQWFLDENPKAIKQIKADNKEFYLHFYQSRRIKEFFSESMSTDRNEPVRKGMDSYGRINDMSWDEFLTRASCYKPSKTLQKYLRDIGQEGSITDNDKDGINLLDWFSRSMKSGLEDYEIDISDIKFVILAGGSSLWPFVADIIKKELLVEPHNIRRSDRPYATISEGLAILPALELKYKNISNKMKDEKQSFLENKLVPFIEEAFNKLVEDITEAVIQDIFDEKIRPILIRFREQGGTVESLKNDISHIADSSKANIKGIVEIKVAEFCEGFTISLFEKIAKWFEEYGLCLPSKLKIENRIETEGLNELSEDNFDLLGIINLTFDMITGAIIAIIVGFLGGGFIMIILAVVATYGGFSRELDKIRKSFEKIKYPLFINKMSLSYKKIDKIRKKLKDDVSDEIYVKSEPILDKIAEQIDTVIDDEIDSLSEINLF